MQSSLRAIVLIAGILLLVAAVMVFGKLGFSASSAAEPAVLVILGLSVFAAGLFMPKQGLWRRTGADEGNAVGNDGLNRAAFLKDDRRASASSENLD